jgi:hypothetical protein
MDILDGRSAVTSVIGLSWLVLEIDDSGYRRGEIKRWFPSAEILLLLGSGWAERSRTSRHTFTFTLCSLV